MLKHMNSKNEASMGTELSSSPRSYARLMWPVKYMATSVAAAPAAFIWDGGGGDVCEGWRRRQCVRDGGGGSV
jgi:hypothetical protein